MKNIFLKTLIIFAATLFITGCSSDQKYLGSDSTISKLPIKTFLALSDTPDSYSGQANKVISVKADASGLEFSSSGSGDVVGSSTSVNGNFPVYKGTTGKIIQDSGYSFSSFLSVTSNFLGPWDGYATNTLPYLSSSLTNWGGTWDGFATDTLPYLSSSLTAGNFFVGNLSGIAEATSTIFLLGSSIGIGTTTPTFKLTVDGNLYAEEARFVSSTVTTLFANGVPYLKSGGTLTNAYHCRADGTTGGVDCDRAEDASGACGANAVCMGGHTHTTLDDALTKGYFVVGNASNITEATSTIFSLGPLIGIGTTVPTFALTVAGSVYGTEITSPSSTFSSIYNFFDADCAASNYVYGINTDGSLDCRADANTTYSEDMTGFEYTGTSLGFSSGYALPTTASSSTWEDTRNSVYNAKVTATTTITFSFASSSAGTIAYFEDWPLVWSPSVITCTSIHCDIVKDGISVVLNLTDGTNDTNSITCGTTATSSMLTANNTWTMKEQMLIEFGTLTGNPDGIAGQVNCYRTQ